MSETSFYYRDRDQDFWKPSLDIETGIETFENLVLISRLVLRLLELQSWYQDWYRDFKNCSLDIETGIKTQKTGGNHCDRDSCESHCSSLVYFAAFGFYRDKCNSSF